MTFFTPHQTIERMDLPARKIMRVSMDYISILMFCSSLLLIFITGTSTTIDILNTTQSIRDGDTMVSAGGSFELGFFSPGNSKNRYLGIWYHKISVVTVVWVANRDAPLHDSSGVLRITKQGILVLVNRSGGTIWSSNSSRPVSNPAVQLLASGNLVVKEMGDNNLENSLWQSFDYPGDMFLPEMKIGRDMVRGLDWYLSSWRTPDDPSTGNFTFRMIPGGFPDLMVKEGSYGRFRTGPWNGLRFSGTPQLKPNPIYTFGFVMNKKEAYYGYQLTNSSILSRTVLNQNGILQRFIWMNRIQGWELYLTWQIDNCDRYALCGAYGSCNINNSPVCDCLKGFAPRIQKDWDTMDWSGGCVRKTPLNCSGDRFRKYSGIKLPETVNSWYNKSMNLEECRTACLKNCSCTAYANVDIREGGSGCLLWFHNLIDIRIFNENQQDLYVRMAATELDVDDDKKISAKSNRRGQMRIILISIVPTGMLVLGMALVVLVCRKKQQQKRKLMAILKRSSNDNYKNEDQELQLFDLDTMAYATNNFSIGNKLGEGGFGPVYKGILKDGQEIAVKRLSKNSSQGLEEFKNEITHIAKLQHRNLVKLLGCCIQADERMLIYEFMPNNSLDNLIFDQTQSKILDWPTRHHIINGIARGLLYLHQDSRLRIVHRDLKASNILLDDDMNPKISDFGLARCFGGNETEANTKKVVGTYGYISPEYAIDGLYSVKSDVFSFGVLLIEIVSGNRNRGFCHSEHHLNLLGHAWRLFKEGRPLELIASSIAECCNLSEVLRSIHVGLLCVQCNPNDRPSMSTVVLMLCGEGALPQPKQPGFFTDRNLAEAKYSSGQDTLPSVNELTITEFGAR